MKLPTVEPQAKLQTTLQTKPQTKPQAKSKAKLLGAGPKSTYAKSTQQTSKPKTFSPLKRLVSTLAGFKLREYSSVGTQSNSARKSVPKSTFVSVVQNAAEQTATREAVAVPNAANISIPFIKNSKGSRIAFNLLLVRPWVLLIGFWLFSIAVGAIAVEGMVSPKKLKTDLPEAPAEATALTNKNALIKVEQGSEANTTGTVEGIVEDSDTAQSGAARSEVDASVDASKGIATQTATNSSVPVLPLTAMVGTCAAGCLVISRRRAMARMAAARLRSRGRKIRANADASVVKLGQSKLQSKLQSKPGQKVAARKISKPKVERSLGIKPAIAKSPAHAFGLKPTGDRLNKRRQKSQRAASEQPAASSKRALVSRFAAQKAASAQQVSSISRARQVSSRVKSKPARLASRQQSVVSVVPASESHALDWPNGSSLAHQMDVRPPRTASM